MGKEVIIKIKKCETIKEVPVDMLGNPIIEDALMHVDYQTGNGLNAHKLSATAKTNYGKETSFAKVPYKSRIPKRVSNTDNGKTNSEAEEREL